MKLAALLFAYAWVGAYFLGDILSYPASDAMTFTRWLTGNPIVLLIVAALLVSVNFLLVGALFHWLRGEGRWALDGVAAWAGTLLINVVFIAFATHFQMWVRPGGLLSLNQAFNLAAALLGAWLAEGYFWRPGLREAREWLLDTASWARY